MKVDDDEPPLLVENDGQQYDDGTVSAEMEGLQLTKVPITIVTGDDYRNIRMVHRLTWIRLSRSRQDYIA